MAKKIHTITVTTTETYDSEGRLTEKRTETYESTEEETTPVQPYNPWTPIAGGGTVTYGQTQANN